MLWLIINLVLVIFGIGLMIYGKKIDGSEKYGALGYFVVGVIISVFGLVSSLMKILIP